MESGTPNQEQDVISSSIGRETGSSLSSEGLDGQISQRTRSRNDPGDEGETEASTVAALKKLLREAKKENEKLKKKMRRAGKRKKYKSLDSSNFV